MNVAALGHPRAGLGARTPEFDSSWILGCARSRRDSVCLPNPAGPACTAGTSVGVGGPSNDTGRGPGTGKAPPCLGSSCFMKPSRLRLSAHGCWHPRHCPHRPLSRFHAVTGKLALLSIFPRLPRPFQSSFVAKWLTVSISWGLCTCLSPKDRCVWQRHQGVAGLSYLQGGFSSGSSQLMWGWGQAGRQSHKLELCGLWACLLPQAEQVVKSVACLGDLSWAPCPPQAHCSRPTTPDWIR